MKCSRALVCSSTYLFLTPLLTYYLLFRYIVLPKDFEKGYKNNIKKDESEYEFYK